MAGEDSVTLNNGVLKARVNLLTGQLYSLSLRGEEFMHGGGGPDWDGVGWSASEIVPFPVFGSVKNYQVRVGDRTFPIDQHGLPRNTAQIPFEVQSKNQGRITLVQRYDGMSIKNPKFEIGGDRPENARWLPYELTKTFKLKDSGLVCQLGIRNESDVEMPYMIGWHPAFRTLGSVEDGEFLDRHGNKIADLGEVIYEGPLSFGEMPSLEYFDKRSGSGVRVSARNFGNMLLWSPGKLWSPGGDYGMFCIEPTTQLPVVGEAQDYFAEPEKFERLAPGESRTYNLKVAPFK